jgi:NAD(P)H-dependent flavin oxidoreductase YrpB (nitropropane dioxygenase family)
VTGEVEAMALYAGQSVGLVTRIQPASEIVRELAEEAERVLRQLAGLVQAEENAT